MTNIEFLLITSTFLVDILIIGSFTGMLLYWLYPFELSIFHILWLIICIPIILVLLTWLMYDVNHYYIDIQIFTSPDNTKQVTDLLGNTHSLEYRISDLQYIDLFFILSNFTFFLGMGAYYFAKHILLKKKIQNLIHLVKT